MEAHLHFGGMFMAFLISFQRHPGTNTARIMKNILLCLALLSSVHLHAWWDPGHLVTAMIAYMQLDEQARDRVDELSRHLERDYPYVNHFIVTGAWPDDLKTEGVHAFDTWHYTNLPYNPDGVALPPNPEIDVVWAIGEAKKILADGRAKDIDKARFLGFLVHFAADLHQPLHSTTKYSNEQPGGNRGGNGFPLSGEWANLHMLWDDGCGFLSPYNNIRPYGKPQQALTSSDIQSFRDLAEQIMEDYPESSFPEARQTDASFWALESHQLAIGNVFNAPQDPEARGRDRYLQHGDEPSDAYLEQGQEVVRRQLALAGYRLGRVLNELLGS